MKIVGKTPDGLEVGNAWEVRSPEIPKTNWIVGSFPAIPPESLRFMRQSDAKEGVEGEGATDVGIKWFVHAPTDDPSWGENKETSAGRTMSILAGEGEFELVFKKDDVSCAVTLDQSGDFAIWGPGLSHSWTPLKVSTIVTLRWKPTGRA